MAAMIELVQGGSVTSARGFKAGATYAGLKKRGEGVLDLGIVLSDKPATVAATFTSNKVASPSVVLSRQRAKRGTGRAVVANSGCANCAVGPQGLKDATEMAALAARHAGVEADDVLVCSTGMIGVELPMALIRQNMGNIKVTSDGGHSFARAIMTTDTHPKEIAVSVEVSGKKITIGGAAKGAGMIHPNMATMLCFLTTDANLEREFAQAALKEAVDASFNMIDIDGDTSTNDSVILLANGASGGTAITGGTAGAAFQEALTYVCQALAKELARDGEGAERLIEVIVDGAKTKKDARLAARSVASSLLVKAMVHGRDPNWGRIMMAVGKSGAAINESKISIFVNGIQIVQDGVSIPYSKDSVVSSMNGPEVSFQVSLNPDRVGESATAWGCDLTEGYVIENSAYST
ncbi:MAG: bifunctional glutamate N-acetyltransferase/amino-acid acetyltransferase ArgJ [SAR202 cluster bacterium]|nr:bifunctional glutamate N-acetyltransferase/amino-acid acetyltransferase ArgJ [SAR202 cluster bacterium]